MDKNDCLLDRQVDKDYLDRYKRTSDIDDIICELDEKITELEVLRNYKDMSIMHSFAYNHIIDAIELLRSTKDYFYSLKGD